MRVPEINNLGIPPLAGLCSYEEACRIGYSVDHNVDLLKRYNYVETRLNQLFAAHIARTPEWEVKCALSLHLWLDAEHSTSLRKRVSEMREPPLHLDKVPDPRLEVWLDEVIRAADTIELLVGIYRVVKPELVRALTQHLETTNPLIDQPTCRMLRAILREEQEMIAWGEQAIAALTACDASAQAAQAWQQHLDTFLQAAGGITGDQPAPPDLDMPTPRANGQPYEMDVIPQRDARFSDHFNQSARIDEYYRDDSREPDERVYALLYKRLREMDVPEWMGPILYKTQGKPWEYYADMSRQLWDEARHAMLGEVGLYASGMPFYRYPVDLKSSMLLNTQFSPAQAHLVLYGIEHSLMPRETGKRWEWVIANEADMHLAALIQDYDWADEVLHVQIGRRWLVPEFHSLDELRAAFADLWAQYLEAGAELGARSPQAEWWPMFVAEARARRGAAHVARIHDQSSSNVMQNS